MEYERNGKKYISSNGKVLGYVDLNGNPVERNRIEYPYSYSAYVVWKNDYNKTDSTVYSDRLKEWGIDKYNKLCQEIWGNTSDYFDNRTHSEIEQFLSKYFDKNIKLTAIMEECNASNGFPYWRFLYREK